MPVGSLDAVPVFLSLRETAIELTDLLFFHIIVDAGGMIFICPFAPLQCCVSETDRRC